MVAKLVQGDLRCTKSLFAFSRGVVQYECSLSSLDIRCCIVHIFVNLRSKWDWSIGFACDKVADRWSILRMIFNLFLCIFSCRWYSLVRIGLKSDFFLSRIAVTKLFVQLAESRFNQHLLALWYIRLNKVPGDVDFTISANIQVQR